VAGESQLVYEDEMWHGAWDLDHATDNELAAWGLRQVGRGSGGGQAGAGSVLGRGQPASVYEIKLGWSPKAALTAQASQRIGHQAGEMATAVIQASRVDDCPV
jgi:hypothetical protein